MEMISEQQYLSFFDFEVIMVSLEVLLVTACISTIIFILTKNQYVSYLSSAPIFYIFSWIGHGFSNFILLVLSMTVQAGIILFMKRQSKRKLVLSETKKDLQ